jgi:prepilin-type N-terminal cleavage/methylation domain-containing protein
MKNEKGFTLVETLIALLILGIVAVGTLSGLSSSSKGLIATDRSETAKNIAEAQMEYVKGSSYSPQYSTFTPSPVPADWSEYTIRISVSPVPGSPDTGMGNIQQVTVTVSYNNIYFQAQQPIKTITLIDYKVR